MPQLLLKALVLEKTKKELIYINFLGEEIHRGDSIWYYEVEKNSAFLEKEEATYLNGDDKSEFMKVEKGEWTEACLTPAGALLALNEYYKKFGYPPE